MQGNALAAVGRLHALRAQCSERDLSTALLTVYACEMRHIVFTVFDAAVTDPCLDLLERDVEVLGYLVFVHDVGTDIFLNLTKQIGLQTLWAERFLVLEGKRTPAKFTFLNIAKKSLLSCHIILRQYKYFYNYNMKLILKQDGKKKERKERTLLYTLHKNNPIAVFDSGVGGISVLRELVKIMPNEDYIYYGDSKNAPYGTRDKEEVKSLTVACARRLFDQGCKGLVVACNTATSAAVRALREMYPYIPIVGIEPAVKPAAQSGDHPRVLVMATPMTLREEKFKRLMEQYEEQAAIIPLPCPGLMEFIERGDLNGEDLHEYLTKLLFNYSSGQIDAVVLGCTHYPFARPQIQRVLGTRVQIFDGGAGTAREMQRRLRVSGLLREEERVGNVVIENSLSGGDRESLCRRLLELE